MFTEESLEHVKGEKKWERDRRKRRPKFAAIDKVQKKYMTEFLKAEKERKAEKYGVKNKDK